MLAVYGQNVCLSLGSYLDPIPILCNLHLTIPKGCIYGLIGPSGCGKTTLQKCIMGMYKPDHGVISVFGLRPGSPGSSVPGPAVGYMPQEIAMDSELTVREQLTFLGRINNLTRELINSRIDEITCALEMKDIDKRTGQFSGGQQRRISLACTLIHQPSLYLLDEPTVGSDIVLVRKIWNYLKHLRDTTGATIIISTHYIEEVNSADLFGFMSRGMIIIQDSPINFKNISKTRTLEEAILTEYKRFIALPSDQQMSPSFFNEYPIEKERSIRPCTPEPFCEVRNSHGNNSIIFLFIWRYLLRWRFLMIIPFAVFVILSAANCFILFNVYGSPMKQLAVGVVNYGTHSLYLNNITNYLASNELRFHSMPDEISARQAIENGTTTAFIVIPDNWDRHLDSRVSSLFSNDLNVGLIRSSQIKLFQDTTHVGKVLTVATQLFRAVDSLMKNITIASGMSFKYYEFFDSFPVFKSLDEPDILAPKFNFVIRLYVFFMETFTVLLFTFWFRLETNEPINSRLMSLGVKPYHLLSSLMIVATFFMAVPFICIFISLVIILHLPCPSSWLAVVLITISIVICGICKARLIGVYVKSIIGCIVTVNAYNGFIWLLGCVAWPFEGLPYFMKPLAIMIPQLYPATSLIRMTIYGDSIWEAQVYHGIQVATVWAAIHLLIVFILARTW